MIRILLSLLLVFGLLIGCSKGPESGIDISGFDKSANPKDNYYQYINGKWLERTEIPADKSNYGAFTALYDQSQIDLRIIIEESAAHKDKKEGSDEQKVGDFYLDYMDSNLVEELRLTPLKSELAMISKVNNREDLLKLIAYFKKINIQIPFGYWINQDLKQSDQYIGYLNQGGLGLPDRDYYFRDDEKFRDIRKKYVTYVTELLSMGGIENADKKAKTIFEIETNLAKGHWTRVQNRDRNKTYNKYSIKSWTN